MDLLVFNGLGRFGGQCALYLFIFRNTIKIFAEKYRKVFIIFFTNKHINSKPQHSKAVDELQAQRRLFTILLCVYTRIYTRIEHNYP